MKKLILKFYSVYFKWFMCVKNFTILTKNPLDWTFKVHMAAKEWFEFIKSRGVSAYLT